VLVFTRTKHGANALAEHLNKAGISAAAIHGNKSQGARTRALADFKSGSWWCWWPPTSPRAASTSTSCRTWSTSSCPTSPEDYVHRIGRTGRAGASRWSAIDELGLLRDIELRARS
jgi:ATP-dependent RNA helicase RhlE